MKNFEVLVLISMMVTNGKGIKANVNGRDFRLERNKNGYDMWHDETKGRLALVVSEDDHHLIDEEWGNAHCDDLDYTQCRFTFNKGGEA